MNLCEVQVDQAIGGLYSGMNGNGEHDHGFFEANLYLLVWRLRGAVKNL
jgi:hypothetical protein